MNMQVYDAAHEHQVVTGAHRESVAVQRALSRSRHQTADRKPACMPRVMTQRVTFTEQLRYEITRVLAMV